MSKSIDYPKASFKNSLELAKATYDLGDSKIETCADKLGKKNSGAFNNLLNAAVKFGLIKRKKGILSTTDLYDNIETSYSEEEENNYLIKAFLNPVLFNSVYEKYKDTVLPVDILENILIREFEVDQRVAKQVSGYFKTGAKATKLLNDDNTFVKINSDDNNIQESNKESAGGTEQVLIKNKEELGSQQKNSNYFINITGPENFSFSTIIKNKDNVDALSGIIEFIKSKITNKAEDENIKSVTESDD